MMLHYTKFHSLNNSGKWITFVHGAGGSSSIWYNQVRFFKKYFNVLLVDLRGHGKSKASPDGTEYTFDNVINDLVEVLDYNKIKKSHFVGISLGSILIQKMLFSHKERVEKIGLGGAILNLNFQSKIMMLLGKLTQSIFPFIGIYTLFLSTFGNRVNYNYYFATCRNSFRSYLAFYGRQSKLSIFEKK